MYITTATISRINTTTPTTIPTITPTFMEEFVEEFVETVEEFVEAPISMEEFVDEGQVTLNFIGLGTSLLKKHSSKSVKPSRVAVKFAL